MHHRLVEIISEKREEVAKLKKNRSIMGDHNISVRRDFKAAISAPQRINLIAEIKFASPSAGRIREPQDPTAIARVYEKAGAAAISLLTDKRFFQGDLNHLPLLKRSVALPILRKDFIIDDAQVLESFFYGADAILLIARILSQQQLSDLMAQCRELGMAPLTEIHDRDDLEKAITCGSDIIGINHRDLDTFKVDVNATFELAPLVPDHCVVISESGLEKAADIQSLKIAGIHAILVGSALMRSDDTASKTKELVHAGKMRDA